MNILITGGAGYIGSHVAKQLLENTEYNIIILDNLSTGNIKAIKTLRLIRHFKFIQLDLKKFKKVDKVIKKYNIDTIIHFAASSIVAESVINPLKYYTNNTVNSTNLINCAVRNNVKKFIFSSTAATYGEPANITDDGIDENCETNPINPYGMSKLMSEQILKDASKTNNNLKFVIFRYFNVAGADITYIDEKLSPQIGEMHEPETHLVPLVVKTALGKRDAITIFGNDYDTNDGTCIRDYIHVVDLANAHIKAIEYLENNDSDIFNCGYGHGYSVREIIDAVKKVSNSDFKVQNGQRRVGDPAILVANNSKIRSKMNWEPQYDDLDLICKSAYEWEKRV